jgi:hypothetical protein
MENNIGKIDRGIRLILGFVLLIIAFASNLSSGWLSYTIITLGMVFTSTAVIGICPLYSIFGFRTGKI